MTGSILPAKKKGDMSSGCFLSLSFFFLNFIKIKCGCVVVCNNVAAVPPGILIPIQYELF